MKQELENYGQTISPELSKALMAYTGKNDRSEVNHDTNISPSTLRDVARGVNPLTESNSVGILALVQCAVNNCIRKESDAKKTRKFLSKLIK